MHDRELYERMHASLRASARLITAGAADSRLIERDGLVACVVPSAPERSFFNSVVYVSPGDVLNALDELAVTFESEGVHAWTVWVPEHDRDVAVVLGRRGHILDADPAAMALELDRFEGQPTPAVAIDFDPDIADIARMNDVAYGFDGDFVRALGGLPGSTVHRYAAVLDGRPAAGMMTLDVNGDCLIAFVATLPEARGRGLASALMTRSLLDARERGCTTSSLQATKMGQPIYERLGFRDLGPLQMWEKRKP